MATKSRAHVMIAIDMGIKTKWFAGLRATALLLLAVLLASGAARAGETDVLLTIEIRTDEDTAAQTREFTLEDLESMPHATFRTNTLWTSGPQDFEGLWLATLLERIGVTQGELILTAINDYSVSARAEEFAEGGALLAYSRNGMPMTPREKGPLWLVWNYDAEPAFRTESIYALSVWQLDRITVSR